MNNEDKKCEKCGTIPGEELLCNACDYCQKLEGKDVDIEESKRQRIRQLSEQRKQNTLPPHVGSPPRNMSGFPQGMMGQGMNRPMPITVSSLTVFPTNRCNQACDYCFIYEQARRRGNLDMSEDIGYRMINWLALTSTAEKPNIHWFGGEPLVAFQLIKKLTGYGNMIMKGTGRKIHWGMTTNLTLVDDQVNEFLKANQYNVLCSIDGGKKSHNKHRVYRDTKIGTFDSALAGLKRVLSWQGSAGTTVRWTIAPDCTEDICEDSLFYYDDIKADVIAHEFVYEHQWTDDELVTMENQFRDLLPHIVDHIKKDRKVESKPVTDGLEGFTAIDRLNARGLRCGLANGSYGVSTTGELFRCHRFVDQMEHKVGDVVNGLNQDLCRKINSEFNVANILPPSGDEMTCMYCPARMICNAGCLAVNWDMTHNILNPPKSFCQIAQMKIRLAGELRKQLRVAGVLEKYTQRNRGQVC